MKHINRIFVLLLVLTVVVGAVLCDNPRAGMTKAKPISPHKRAVIKLSKVMYALEQYRDTYHAMPPDLQHLTGLDSSVTLDNIHYEPGGFFSRSGAKWYLCTPHPSDKKYTIVANLNLCDSVRVGHTINPWAKQKKKTP